MIDGIAVDFKIFIVVAVWLLKVHASGSRFMLSSVHSCWAELWSFPDDVFVIGYLFVSCSLVLNSRVFHSNCKLFHYNFNFVERYYFVKIYVYMVYFDFGTVQVNVFKLSWIQLSIIIIFSNIVIIIVQISRKIIVIVVSLL